MFYKSNLSCSPSYIFPGMDLREVWGLVLLRDTTPGNLNFNSSPLAVNAQKWSGFGGCFILLISTHRTGEGQSVQKQPGGPEAYEDPQEWEEAASQRTWQRCMQSTGVIWRPSWTPEETFPLTGSVLCGPCPVSYLCPDPLLPSIDAFPNIITPLTTKQESTLEYSGRKKEFTDNPRNSFFIVF